MKIYPEQLTARLSKGLHQAYLLFGNEPLLKQEAIDQVLKAAAKQGFDEKHRFSVDKQLNWQDVNEICQALSLFSSRQIIILTLPDTPLTATQTTPLKTLTALLHQDILLIVEGPKLNRNQESSQWFTLLQKNGVYAPCNSPDLQQLPRFIETRCKNMGLMPDPESVKLLASWHEGNLLALSQSLMKLQLIYPDGRLTLIRLQETLSRHNHYTPFQLTDALIEGKAKRAIRIVQQLRAEGVEITLLLRTIQKELVQLCKIQEHAASGIALRQLFDQFHIWQAKRTPLTAALHRLSPSTLRHLLHLLADIEIRVKSDFDSEPWSALNAFCIEMCGYPTHLTKMN